MLEQCEAVRLYRLSTEITNRSTNPMNIYVEPWGDEFELLPNESIQVVLIAPTIRTIPVSFGENSITVEGWEGTRSEVWKNQTLLN